jgi:hypothetical protein
MWVKLCCKSRKYTKEISGAKEYTPRIQFYLDFGDLKTLFSL